MTAAKSAASATVDAASKPKLVHGIMKVQSVSLLLRSFSELPKHLGLVLSRKFGSTLNRRIFSFMTFAAKNTGFYVVLLRSFEFKMSGLPDVFRVPAKNPSNKKEILCDEKLKAIFDGNDMVNFQGVAKLLSNHFPKKA
ncbi:SWIB/MDM2 domain superfamily protein [Perilla frutescens var. frutescens]|nr:SWIB/MDM2 domain superfamily protein [Perilla frutescens var. frutescens]